MFGTIAVTLGKRVVGNFVMKRWRGLAIGAAALVVAAALGMFYLHYNRLVETVATQAANNARMEIALNEQRQTIAAQQSAIEEWAQAQANLITTIEDLREADLAASDEVRRLNDIFSQHDLSRLAISSPGLVETRINRGTDRAQCLLERATGAAGPDCTD